MVKSDCDLIICSGSRISISTKRIDILSKKAHLSASQVRPLEVVGCTGEETYGGYKKEEDGLHCSVASEAGYISHQVLSHLIDR